MEPKVAETVFNIPVDKTFHYNIPEEFKSRIKVGQRIEAELQSTLETGIVVGILEKSNIPRMKDIYRLVDEYPFPSEQTLSLARWIKKRYLCAIGQAMSLLIPAGLPGLKSKYKEQKWQVNPPSFNLELFPLSSCHLDKFLDQDTIKPIFLQYLYSKDKMRVYAEIIRRTVSTGKRVLIIVPETYRINSIVEVLKKFNNYEYAMLYSGRNDRRKWNEWMKVKYNLADVIIGSRLAIFAPVESLGLIIIDDEHDPSYQLTESPRFNVRDVVLERGKRNESIILMTSQTPSIESWYAIKKNEFDYLLLSIQKSAAPVKVEIVDLKKDPEILKKGTVSTTLRKSIGREFEKNNKAIIFINRLGYSKYISCQECGHIISCPNCRVTLTHHLNEKSLICHYCNYYEGVPDVCPRCGGMKLRGIGLGGEKIEKELSNIFGENTVLRLDSETASGKKREEILKLFREEKKKILVGTQMVLRALDDPGVSLIGVIMADALLNFPDFRASEIAFYTMFRIIMKSWESKRPREIIVQGVNINHYLFESMFKMDSDIFYRNELEVRKELFFPPYSNMINILIRGRNEEKISYLMNYLIKYLRKDLPEGIKLYGPVSAPIEKVRQNYRMQILIKAPVGERVFDYLGGILSKFQQKPNMGRYVMEIETY